MLQILKVISRRLITKKLKHCTTFEKTCCLLQACVLKSFLCRYCQGFKLYGKCFQEKPFSGASTACEKALCKKGMILPVKPLGSHSGMKDYKFNTTLTFKTAISHMAAKCR